MTASRGWCEYPCRTGRPRGRPKPATAAPPVPTAAGSRRPAYSPRRSSFCGGRCGRTNCRQRASRCSRSPRRSLRSRRSPAPPARKCRHDAAQQVREQRINHLAGNIVDQARQAEELDVGRQPRRTCVSRVLRCGINRLGHGPRRLGFQIFGGAGRNARRISSNSNVCWIRGPHANHG